MKHYDLDLPVWGPYNKKYLGAAHIADRERGFRFDVNLFPGYYRRSVMTPRDLSDCGAKMMAASTDASHFVYRYELEWKDRVYVEADFCAEGDQMQITCDFVNRTNEPESLTLNAVMSMQMPSKEKEELIALEAITGADTQWIDVLDYCEIHNDQQVALDGLLLGECRGSGFVKGSYLGGRLFGKAGDRAVYRFEKKEVDQIGLRYRGGGRIAFEINGEVFHFELPEAKEPVVKQLDIPRQEAEGFVLLAQGSKLDIDGFVLGKDIKFSDSASMLEPVIAWEEQGFTLQFEKHSYRIEYEAHEAVLRTLHTEDAGVLLSQKIHDHVNYVIGNEGHTHVDLFVRPVFVEPQSSQRVVIKIKALKSEQAPSGDKDFEQAASLYRVQGNDEGAAYELSQNIMSAVTLTNVVWPIYSRREYIRHNTPGRNWDSLYTWDSGFIGMGLLQMDVKRAEECLNAYLTPVGDVHSPYIFHGTPLPTQIFLMAEIYNKTGSSEILQKYYAMLRQQYRFFADARKRLDAKENGLFNTWRIFYNSGGWDDYPTQVYVHQNQLEEAACPMVNVSVTVLCAKILKMLAQVIGENTDEYDEDINFYSEAVEHCAWDEESGYYGYVMGDQILKVDGINADMGMDGAYPYIAGISKGDRAQRIVENIKEGMFTPIGVSVVDVRAPYFKKDGYWNGSVWMPHQWILWKAFLDHGELELAMQIADTALNVWKKEVDLTYNCYEHFMLANGRGAGFHQFSGLSTPVLMWYNALYKPYTVTGGFRTLIHERKIDDDQFSFHVQSESAAPALLVCLEEEKQYAFKTSGKVRQLKAGLYSLCFDHPMDETIEIRL